MRPDDHPPPASPKRCATTRGRSCRRPRRSGRRRARERPHADTSAPPTRPRSARLDAPTAALPALPRRRRRARRLGRGAGAGHPRSPCSTPTFGARPGPRQRARRASSTSTTTGRTPAGRTSPGSIPELRLGDHDGRGRRGGARSAVGRCAGDALPRRLDDRHRPLPLRQHRSPGARAGRATDRRGRRVRRALRSPAVAPPRLLPVAGARHGHRPLPLGRAGGPDRPHAGHARGRRGRRDDCRRLRAAGSLRRGDGVAAILKERAGSGQGERPLPSGVSARGSASRSAEAATSPPPAPRCRGVDLAAAERAAPRARSRPNWRRWPSAEPAAPSRTGDVAAPGSAAAGRPRTPRVERATMRFVLHTIELRDFAIADDVVVELGPGLNVLTGETGAGKSLVVDALALLAGGRADAGMVRAGRPYALVQATWREGDDERAFARRVAHEERNVARIDGEVVAVAELRQALAPRVGIFGQHAFRTLLEGGEQRDAARPRSRLGRPSGARALPGRVVRTRADPGGAVRLAERGARPRASPRPAPLPDRRDRRRPPGAGRGRRPRRQVARGAPRREGARGARARPRRARGRRRRRGRSPRRGRPCARGRRPLRRRARGPRGRSGFGPDGGPSDRRRTRCRPRAGSRPIPPSWSGSRARRHVLDGLCRKYGADVAACSRSARSSRPSTRAGARRGRRRRARGAHRRARRVAASPMPAGPRGAPAAAQRLEPRATDVLRTLALPHARFEVELAPRERGAARRGAGRASASARTAASRRRRSRTSLRGASCRG